jgi:uncharacterized DUF497 family protein
VDDPAGFAWDHAKAHANMDKHGVSFPFAARVFADGNLLLIDASRDSDGEGGRRLSAGSTAIGSPWS